MNSNRVECVLPPGRNDGSEVKASLGWTKLNVSHFMEKLEFFFLGEVNDFSSVQMASWFITHFFKKWDFSFCDEFVEPGRDSKAEFVVAKINISFPSISIHITFSGSYVPICTKMS